MNIFKVLSQGRGKITETNMSAMLAYLLNPSETHGLGDRFLREFLEIIDIKNSYYNIWLSSNKLIADIEMEESYELPEKKRSIDIEIKIYEKSDKGKEVLRIGIENKIKASSAQKEQFHEEYLGLKKTTGDNVDIIMVFLTPKCGDSRLFEEYNELDLDTTSNDKKVWIYWHDQDFTAPFLKAFGQEPEPRIRNSIAEILSKFLLQESTGEVDPISSYVRDTLKSFNSYIRSVISAEVEIMRAKPTGDITEEATFYQDTDVYKIIRNKDNSIVIINNADGTTIHNTKDMLRKIIKHLKLNIDLYHPSGSEKNTQNLGKEVIRSINGGPNLSGGGAGTLKLI